MGLDGLDASSDAGSTPASSTNQVSKVATWGILPEMGTWKVAEGDLTINDRDVILQGRGHVTHVERAAIRNAEVVTASGGGCLWFIPILYPVLFFAWLKTRHTRIVTLHTDGSTRLAFTTDVRTWPAINEALALGL